MMDAAPPIWLPPKPAIIRPIEHNLLRPGFLPASRAERRAAIKDLIARKVITPEQAKRALVGFFVPAVGWGAEPISLTPINGAASDTDASSYDFGNFNAPTAGLMVVGIIGWSGSNRTVSSCGIGGTNGALHGTNPNSTSPRCFASRQVAAGNNNVTVVFSGSAATAFVHVWLLTGNLSDTPTANFEDVATGVSISTSTLTIPANGYGMYVASNGDNGNATTWLDSANERFDDPGGDRVHSAADKFSATLLTSDTVRADWPFNHTCVIASASWA